MEEVSDPLIAPMGIGLRWPSADQQLRLLVMIQGDREDLRRAQRGCTRWRAAPPRRPSTKLARAASTTPITAGSRRTSPSGCWPSRSGSGPRSRTLPPIRGRWCASRFRHAAGRDADPDQGGGGRQRGRCRDQGIGRRRGPRRQGSRRDAGGGGGPVRRRAEGGAGRAEPAGTDRRGCRAVVVYAPDEVRDLTDAHGPVPSLALLRAVKDEFDPEHRWRRAGGRGVTERCQRRVSRRTDQPPARKLDLDCDALSGRGAAASATGANRSPSRPMTAAAAVHRPAPPAGPSP